MQIRRLRNEDFDQSLELIQYAFQKKFNDEQINHLRSHFEQDHCYGIFDENQLLAQLAVLSLETYINNKKISTGGVTRVSSWPQQRRHGLVKKLILHALEGMKERGQTVSYLGPFSFEFYRKYGWEIHSEYKKYLFEKSQFPLRVETEGRVEIRNTDIESFMLVYDQYAARFNGSLVRTKEWWKKNVLTRKKGHRAVYLQEDGTPIGYIIYGISEKGNAPQPKQFPLKRRLDVYEFVFLNEESRSGLLTFIANHDSTVEEISLTVPMDDSLPLLISDPTIKQEVVPYFMTRIVDVQGFLEEFSWNPRENGSEFVLHLTDSTAPWNNGLWLVTVNEKGQAELNHCQADSALSNNKLEISCDIRTLSAMMLGYKRPLSLIQVDLLKGDKEAALLLEELIPKRSTYMLDFF